MEESDRKRICTAIEEKVGHKMRTPKDFELLSDAIVGQLHQRISTSTLKRLWGYVSNDFTPRISTLNVLAQFAGYDDWDSFCKESNLPHTQDIEEPADTPAEPPARRRRLSTNVKVIATLLIGAITVAAAIWLTHRQPAATNGDSPSPYLLHQGQHFATEQDYLPLFGILAEDSLWGQRLPHHTAISVWTPLYHHPEWHNDGDSAALLPTITEWWEPTDEPADSTLVTIRNQDRLVAYRDLNELRITFMRGLTPDSITYLGVYRLDLKRSTPQRLVWQRVLDDLDLNRLSYIEELRN